ncbi:uncharacterized protein TM35_000034440 [Trypanosoma theileri]|uniref:Uncharacterized protein n=1 Tax=Trypanosoma theileri TaxID=67003 RepID=A0A1X0P790_9TRYP|nr:uncharacterized protein TM35_000034440 [Trypanosoma theileri]ORC92691.1 hypothetical protein TM35_000034440 [Trypanosoma theileri]
MESKPSKRKSVATTRKASVTYSHSSNGSTARTFTTSVAATSIATNSMTTRSRLISTRTTDNMWKSRSNDRRSTGERSRVTTLRWEHLPSFSTRTERQRGSMSTTASIRRRWHARVIGMLHVAFYSSLFVAAMRRVAARYRKRVIWETVEKPKAAFKIQTAWRAYRQRRRFNCKAAAELLGPILRSKIMCLLIVKEKCALFLQRVFRSQRERHFMHWLYQQMKYNKALNVVRKFLERYVAKRHLLFLTLQRDERDVCEERCAMMAQSLIREERAELMRILHWMNTSTQSNLTPLVTKAMLEYETKRCTDGSSRPTSSLVTRMRDVTKNFSLSLTSSGREIQSEFNPLASSTSGLETIYNSGNGTLESTNPCVWNSILHNEESARVFIDGLFRRKIPSYPLYKEDSVQPPFKKVSNIAYKSTMNSQIELKRSQDHELNYGLSLFPSRPVSAKLGSDLDINKQHITQDFSFYDGSPSLNGLVDAFLELLLRTESIERKSLVLEYQDSHNELIQQLKWVATTLHATTATPPLYASLLGNMQETWLVERAKLLFRQEHESRLKLVREYEAIPLRFLNRPLLNNAAEERRTRLVEGVRKIKETEEANGSTKRGNTPSEVGSYQDRKENTNPLTPFMDSMHPSLRPLSREKLSTAKSQTILRPISASSRPPLPPSPPPRKREDMSGVVKSAIHQGGQRYQQQQQEQQQQQQQQYHHYYMHNRPTEDDVLPRFFTATCTLSPDSPMVSANVNSTPSVQNAEGDFGNDTDRGPIAHGKSSVQFKSNALLPSFLSFFTAPGANSNTKTNNIVEFPYTDVNRHVGSISSVDSGETPVLPHLKGTSSGGRLNTSSCNSGLVYATEGKHSNEKAGRILTYSFMTGSNLQSVGDSLLITKSTLGGNQTNVASTTRGVPIPLLRASPTPDRSTLPPIQTIEIVRDREPLEQKESGADYVCDRRGRRFPSPLPTKEALAAAATLREERCASPSSLLFSPMMTRSLSPVRIRIGRTTDPRKKKDINIDHVNREPEMSNAP